MNKKFIFIGAGALVLLLLIILISMNCGGPKKSTTVGDKTLTIWGLYDDPAVYNEVISDFQNKNPTYKVTYVKKDPAEYEAAALGEIAAGKGPDIWAIPNDWVPKYQDKLVPMTDGLIANKKAKKNDVEVYSDLFAKVVVKDNVLNSKIYGMPLYIDTLVLFYNRSLLSKSLNNYVTVNPKIDSSAVSQIFARGPKNWDEFVQMTKIITKKSGNNISQSAVTLGTANNINQGTDILTLLMLQDGVKMISDDQSIAQFHTKQNVFGGQDFPGAQALNFYTAFANPKTDLYTWNNSLGDSLHAFASGKAAMTIDYASAKADITRINPNFEYNFFAMPQVKETANPINYASYMTFTVTKAAKNPAIAWQFINMMTHSSRTNTYVSKIGKQSAQLMLINGNSEIPAKQALNAQNWYNPDSVKTEQIFTNAIQQVNDGKDPQTAIEYAGSQITSLLGKLKQ